MHDLNDMFFFSEVVERGGFAAAGRSLGLPKSRLSRRVAELETRLGVRLLQRTTRRLSLTDVGAQFMRHCKAMRKEAEAAAEVVAQIHAEPRGTLRVTCPVTLAQTVMGDLLPRFIAQYPQVRVEMQVLNRAVNLVEDGIDVALRVRATLDDSGSLVVKPLCITRTLLVASPAQLERQGHPITPADLDSLDTVDMAAIDGRSLWRLQGPDGKTHEWTHHPRCTIDDLLTLKHTVIGGVGVSALPDFLCQDDIQTGRLVTVLPGWSLAPGRVHAVFASRRGLAPVARRFLDFLGEHLQTPPSQSMTPSA